MGKWIRRIAFAALTLAVLYLGAGLWVGTVADSRLEAELAAIRERGEPMRLEEMAPPPVPDENNAAIPLSEAAALMKDDTPEEGEALRRFLEAPGEVDDQSIALVRSWVDRNAPALEKLETAVKRPDCRFDIDYTNAREMDFPQIMHLVNAGNLVVARALLSERDGQVHLAFADTWGALWLAGLTGSDPVIILLLTRIVIEDRALNALQYLLSKHAPPEQFLEPLRAELKRFDTRESLARVLIGERCFGISAYETIPDEDRNEWKGAWTRLDWTGTWIRLDQARYLNLMARAIELARRPWREVRQDWTALEADCTDAPWYGNLSQMILVSLTPIVTRVEAHRARLDMARIALGAAVDRPDPFTEKPYEVRKAADGGREIWSPGPDPDDEEDDVVWRLPAR